MFMGNDVRLIDADRFIEDIKCEIINQHLKGLKGTPYDTQDLLKFISRIQEQPTVDAQPIRYGKWVWKDRHRNSFRVVTGRNEHFEKTSVVHHEEYTEQVNYCSLCGAKGDDTWMKFCPNCGAKMFGGDK